MNKKIKNKSFIGLAITLLLIFLCAFSSTYAFFSIEQRTTQNTQMTDFYVYMYYRGGGSSNDRTQLHPTAGSTIARGNVFGITNRATNTSTTPIGFGTTAGSTTAYVRFWIDAYLESEPSVNYGKYFSLYKGANPVLTEETTCPIACLKEGGLPKVYYVKTALASGVMGDAIFDSLMLSWDAPNEMLSDDLVIAFSFDAVQSTNKAYLYTFNDDKGYYSSWS